MSYPSVLFLFKKLSDVDKIFGVIFLIFLFGWVSCSRLLPVHVDIQEQPFVSDGLATVSGGSAFGVIKGSIFPMIGFGVALEPNARYRACLPVLRASAGSSVVVDLTGNGYDNSDQEHRFDVVKKSTKKDYCFDFYSEFPPADTGVRVMFEGVGGVVPGSLEFSRPVLEKVRYPALLDASRFAAIISLFIFVFLVAGKRVGSWLRRGISASLDQFAVLGLWVLASGVVCVAFWVAFSSAVPWVFSDEYTYAWLSKHDGDIAGAAKVGLVSTLAHSFLYFNVYGAAFSTYADPYIVAKAMNVIFWLGAGIAAFLAARRFMSIGLSVLLATVVIASPWMIYTRLFMPEVMYYFGFWCCVAALVWLWRPDSFRGEIVFGLALGCLSLVKSHALFLLPGFAIGLMLGRFVLGAGDKRRRILAAAMSAIALVIAWYLSKLTLTQLMGSSMGDAVGMAGGYGGEVSRMVRLFSEPQKLISVMALFVRHAGIAMISTGGVVVVLCVWLARFLKASSHQKSEECVAASGVGLVMVVSSLVTLLGLLVITAVFTVAVSGAGPHESLDRTHTRYYGFILPFVLFAGVYAATRLDVGTTNKWKSVSCALLSCALIGSGVFLVNRFALHANDGPDALVYSMPVLGAIAWVACFVVAGVSGLFDSRLRAVIIGAWGVTFGLANVAVYAERYHELTSVVSEGERIGLSAAFHVDHATRDDGLIIAKEAPVDLYRILFHLNSMSPVRIESECWSAMERAVKEKRAWVITYGYAEKCASGIEYESLGDGVKLYRISGKIAVSDVGARAGKLKRSHAWELGKGGNIRIVSGHPAESWGTWLLSEGYFEFSEPVNGVVNVMLHVHGFGPNVGRSITAKLGESEQQFVLSAHPQQYFLEFDNVQGATSLRFEGLEGFSPKSLGEGGDSRELAMGVRGMTMEF